MLVGGAPGPAGDGVGVGKASESLVPDVPAHPVAALEVVSEHWRAVTDVEHGRPVLVCPGRDDEGG